MGMSLSVLAADDPRRIYILDTNVLLHDPSSIFRFQEHVVLLPLTILEEIDAKKHDAVIGYNAREISLKLENLLLRESNGNGIPIPNGRGGVLYFLSDHLAQKFPRELSLGYRDNLMLAQTLGLRERFPGREIVFVTKDRNLRIKMRAMGIRTQDYRHDKISEEFFDGLFKPLRRLTLNTEEINALFSSSRPADWQIPYRRMWQLRENEGVVLVDEEGREFGLAVRKGSRLKFLDYESVRVLGIAPKVLDDQQGRNYEQAVCMHHCLDESIRVQVIIGRAGTGKTYIAMAAALQMVLKENRYESIKLVKPIVTRSRLGEDIGFLPGSVKRKLIPRMRPFMEKLRLFTGDQGGAEANGYHKLIDSEVIELINIADVRGADLTNSIVIFDEAQNANPFQMRTLGTRLGENTKLMVLGDPTQIDNIYLDKYSNALINLYLNSLKYPKRFLAQTCLTQMVRSHTSQWFEETIQDPVREMK
jgi:PhoH-like ATPase